MKSTYVFTIHYHASLGYDIEVLAESYEDAMRKADNMIDDISFDEYELGNFVCEGVVDIEEV